MEHLNTLVGVRNTENRVESCLNLTFHVTFC